MSETSRRRFVTGAAAATAAAGAGGALAAGSALAQQDAPASAAAGGADFAAVSVGKGDARYDDLAIRGLNKRFTTRPRSFVLCSSTEQVVRAVGEAVRAGRRISVRSGGHCFENFVGDPDVEVVIDLAEMDSVGYDARRRAFEVGPGARLGQVYRTLYYGWDVTIPGGASSSVAFGGHVVGGGYGPLSRRHGISSDHLYAVEVVVVDREGRSRAVIATREKNDPNRELWWAHTGGGGGNFGIVTRYWFRSPGAKGDEPSGLLPRPPRNILASTVMYPREGMTKANFRTLVGNHGRWHERHSGTDSPYRGLFSGLVLLGKQHEADQGMAAIAFTHLDGGLPDARKLLADHTAAVSAGVGVEPMAMPVEEMPWLASVNSLAQAQDAEVGRQKIQCSYLRRSFSDEQIDVLHERLSGLDHANDTSSVSIQSYGGAVNAVAPDATAMAQRDSVLKAVFMNTWQDPAKDTDNVDWMRRLFADVYAGTGGVPEPGGQADGCYINFPDVDMADPRRNRSGTPWHELYYKENYPRLQKVKAAYDPRDEFRHALSVRLPKS